MSLQPGILDFMIKTASDPVLRVYLIGLGGCVIVFLTVCYMIYSGYTHYETILYENSVRRNDVYFAHRYSKNGCLKFNENGCIFYRGDTAISNELDNISAIEFGGTDDDRILVISYDSDKKDTIYCGAMNYKQFLKIRDLIIEYAGDESFRQLRRNYG